MKTIDQIITERTERNIRYNGLHPQGWGMAPIVKAFRETVVKELAEDISLFRADPQAVEAFIKKETEK